MKKNTIKKIGALSLGSLVIASPFAAYAEDTNTSIEDSFNEDDVVVFEDEGVKVRLAQLEQRLEIQIDHALELIQEAQELNKTEVDYDALDLIIDDLIELEQSIEALDLDSSEAEYLREVYFDSKEEAKELSRDFRELLQGVFSETEKDELRNELKGDREERLKKPHPQVQKFIDRFNAEKLRGMMNFFNVDNQTIEELRNGTISIQEVKKGLQNEFKSLTPEDKKELRDNLKDKQKLKREEFKERVNNFKQNFREHRENMQNLTEEEREDYMQNLREERSETRPPFR